jgi:hypothetical protein
MTPPRLSTDILNQYTEALMLIEMVSSDQAVLDDLAGWRPEDYRGHFQASKLRNAAEAIAAYDALAPHLRAALDDLLGRLDQRTALAIDELREAHDGQRHMIADDASETLRDLIARAAAFINANGAMPAEAAPAETLQERIDQIFRDGV